MLISIIIPSRDRAQYLGASIATATAVDDDQIEIIVSDNASDDDTEAVVASVDDPRVRYRCTGRKVSMRQNFNDAILDSSGDYVILFGDDDAILPGQFKYLRQICETSRPDGISWTKATYGWPVDGYPGKVGGIRFYADECFGPAVHYDPREKLDFLLACQMAEMYPTPNIYHGCVSRAYLERHKPADGVLFDSTIPDVNFQYRGTYVGGNFVNLRHPFSINGHSPVSTGGAHMAPKTGSAGHKVGQTFRQDNQADPYDDVIDHYLSIHMVFFSTLETLRERSVLGGREPDYVEWYRYALTGLSAKPDAVDNINEALEAHAMHTGTEAALREARARPARPKRSISERATRAYRQARSFRLSAGLDGENTVLTAARVMDDVLGDELGGILAGDVSHAAAWRRARARSRAFKREL